MNEEEYWSNRCNEEMRQMQIYYGDVGYQAIRPSTVYKPKIFVDGNQWCVLYGEDLQSGVAGFGESPEKAMDEFDKEWKRELSANIQHKQTGGQP